MAQHWAVFCRVWLNTKALQSRKCQAKCVSLYYPWAAARLDIWIPGFSGTMNFESRIVCFSQLPILLCCRAAIKYITDPDNFTFSKLNFDINSIGGNKRTLEFWKKAAGGEVVSAIKTRCHQATARWSHSELYIRVFASLPIPKLECKHIYLSTVPHMVLVTMGKSSPCSVAH